MHISCHAFFCHKHIKETNVAMTRTQRFKKIMNKNDCQRNDYNKNKPEGERERDRVKRGD